MKNKTSVGPIFKGGELSDRGSWTPYDWTKWPSSSAVFGLEINSVLSVLEISESKIDFGGGGEAKQ